MQKTEKKRKRSNTLPPINHEEESVEEAAATVEEKEKGQFMAMMPQLPQEILMDILSRLPVKTLLRFRCVSKGWHILITDPNFITQHLKFSTENCHNLILGSPVRSKHIFNINYETSTEVIRYDISKISQDLLWMEIVGSSNGLVCLCFSYASFRKKVLYLYNPATLEIKHLPNAPIEYTGTWDFSPTVFGFGFDSITNDYKVVSIHYFKKHGRLRGTIHPSEIRVYSLSTGQWRRLEDASFNISLDTTTFRNAVVNGAIHWMGNYGNFFPEFIISFDLGLETFCEIPGHDHYRHGDKLYGKKVGVLGGCLSVFDVYTNQCIEIWVMKEYGVKDSWTKLFTIDARPRFREFCFANFPVPNPFHSLMPIVMRKNGEVILGNVSELVSYDPKSGREGAIVPGGLPIIFFHCVTYVESLVSLKVGYGQEEEPQA